MTDILAKINKGKKSIMDDINAKQKIEDDINEFKKPPIFKVSFTFDQIGNFFSKLKKKFSKEDK
jgi:hypothetical protein